MYAEIPNSKQNQGCNGCENNTFQGRISYQLNGQRLYICILPQKTPFVGRPFRSVHSLPFFAKASNKQATDMPQAENETSEFFHSYRSASKNSKSQHDAQASRVCKKRDMSRFFLCGFLLMFKADIIYTMKQDQNPYLKPTIVLGIHSLIIVMRNKNTLGDDAVDHSFNACFSPNPGIRKSLCVLTIHVPHKLNSVMSRNGNKL